MSFPPFFAGLPFKGRQAGKKLKWLLAAGETRLLLPDVYVATDIPETPELRATAVALVIPSDAVACGETAAWIHGIPTTALGADDKVPIRWTSSPRETVDVAGHAVASPAATGAGEGPRPALGNRVLPSAVRGVSFGSGRRFFLGSGRRD